VRRVVIDTNVWVSALIKPSGAPAAVVNAFVAGHFQLVVSQPLIDELLEVLARPRIGRRYGITSERIGQVSHSTAAGAQD
jgi:uncharacterized protein